MQSWHLAPMGIDDIQSVVEIERVSFQTPWNHASYQYELSCRDSYNFTVKEHNYSGEGHVIAYICFRIIIDEMHVLKIAVAPEWRHKGIASWLMGKCMDIVKDKGCNKVFLEVRSLNTGAIQFYTKLGFQVIGRRAGYYADTGDDAMIMTTSHLKKRILVQDRGGDKI